MLTKLCNSMEKSCPVVYGKQVYLNNFSFIIRLRCSFCKCKFLINFYLWAPSFGTFLVIVLLLMQKSTVSAVRCFCPCLFPLSPKHTHRWDYASVLWLNEKAWVDGQWGGICTTNTIQQRDQFPTSLLSLAQAASPTDIRIDFAVLLPLTFSFFNWLIPSDTQQLYMSLCAI